MQMYILISILAQSAMMPVYSDTGRINGVLSFRQSDYRGSIVEPAELSFLHIFKSLIDLCLCIHYERPV